MSFTIFVSPFQPETGTQRKKNKKLKKKTNKKKKKKKKKKNKQTLILSFYSDFYSTIKIK